MRSMRVLARFGAVGVMAVGLAACGGGGSSSSGGGGYKEPAGPPVKTITIESANLFFRPKTLTAPSGIIKVVLKNSESGAHTLVFDGVPGFELQVSGDGSSDAKKVQFSKGKHVFYCTIPGHREAGIVQ
jgi:hypothetical protein